MEVKISDIIIKERVRGNLGDLNPLMESLDKFGQIHPILLNQKLELIAGNRRLEAAKQLGWVNINANIIETVDKVNLLELEIEENIQRKDFSEEDILKAYRKLEKLKHKSLFRRIIDFFKNIFKKLFGKDMRAQPKSDSSQKSLKDPNDIF